MWRIIDNAGPAGNKSFNLAANRSIRDISFSEEYVVLLTSDHNVELWGIYEEPIKKKSISKVGFPSPNVNKFALSRDGKSAIIGFEDHSPVFYDVETGEILGDIPTLQGKLKSASFYPAGGHFVAVDSENRAVFCPTPEQVNRIRPK